MNIITEKTTKEEHNLDYQTYPQTFVGGLKGHPEYSSRIEPLYYEIRDGAKVLDVGCNNGEFMALLRDKKKCKVWGVDLSEVALAEAKKKDLNVSLADCENLPFRDSSFDVVVLMEVLVHVYNPGKALQEIRRVLKPNGILLGSTPHENLERYAWDDKRMHHRYYNEETLTKALTDVFPVNYLQVLKGAQFAVSMANSFLADKPAEILFKCGGKDTKPWEEELLDRSKLRVWFGPTLPPGVAYYRMTGFAEKMRKMGAEIGFEEFNQADNDGPGEWQKKISRNPEFPTRPLSFIALDQLEKILRAADLSVWQVAQLRDVVAFLRCAKDVVKKPIITEVDDWIFDLPSYNVASGPYQPNSEVEWIAYQQMKLSDALIVSTNFLKEQLGLMFPGKPIYVVKNSIDFDVWDNLQPIEPIFGKKKEGMIRIGYTGCGNHEGDMAIIKEPMCYILQEHDNVEFVLPVPFRVFDDMHHPRVLRSDRWVTIDQFPHTIAGWGMDIGIAPLRENNFNCAKSNLRWLEYSALHLPTVASPVQPFKESIKHGKDGFLCDSKQEWYETLKMLVKDEEKRRSVGEAAYNKVKKDYNMAKVAKTYKSILEVFKRELN